MLIKMVPYYPGNMRQTHRVTHHLNVASNISYVLTQPRLAKAKR